MADLNGFNATQVEPTTSFEPLPAGKYLAAITESAMKPTKSNNGNFLELTFQVLDGEYKNRFVWARLNLNNPSDKAVEIARSELSAICHAVGVMQPRDSVELHNLPLTITVKCVKRDDTGEITNELKSYAPKAAATGQPRQAAPTSTTPPWKR